MLTDCKVIGLFVIVNGEIAGFSVARVDFERNTHFGQTLTVELAPTCRRKETAQKFLHEVEVLLRERGVKKC